MIKYLKKKIERSKSIIHFLLLIFSFWNIYNNSCKFNKLFYILIILINNLWKFN